MMEMMLTPRRQNKKLTETDKKRLEKLGEEKEFSEVIRYMLEKNIKLEQECIIE